MKSEILGRKHSVARRLLFSVILMSIAMTILTSTYQLYGNYKRYVTQLEVRFNEIKTIHVKILSDRLWIADLDTLRTNLKELSILPDISYMGIRENNKIIASIGSDSNTDTITKIFPMNYSYKGKTITIGTLKVQATLKNAYHQIFEQMFDILVSNGIKIFILAGFILFIFNQLITRHLQSMSIFAKKLDINNLNKKLSLDRKSSSYNEPDELEILIQAFDSMQNNLLLSIEKVQQSEQHYRQLVETTTAIPWEFDLNIWRFSYVGPQAVNVLGYPVSDWYEDGFKRKHLHSNDSKFTVKYYLDVITEETEHEFEFRMITAEGNTVWIRDDVKVVYENGVPHSLQGYMFDITERKLNEIELDKYRNDLEKLIENRTTELVASNKELEAFAYSVSHDLRAPLRGIDGFSQILIEDNSDSLDETSLEYLNRIRKAAQLMGKIINELLLLSRVTRQELQLTTVNITNISKDTIARLREKDLRDTIFTIEDNLVSEADENLVSIVIENLISNAWKYTSKNPHAEIDIGRMKNGSKNFFYIKDNGIGFSMEYIDKIFLPFQRLHNATEFEGTGIGLANVARVIQRHGGEIYAEAKPGEGATFYFNFS